MEFKGMKKIHQGRFLTRYDLEYKTEDGAKKVYEMISRDPAMETFSDVKDKAPEAVVLIIFDETRERILLNHEFRLATGRWVYNFPAGLIDPGEEPKESAARELREETGLLLTGIDDVMAPSMAAMGFSNEKNLCMVGTATGEFAKSSSAEEEIEPGWYTKEEVAALVKTEIFAGRTQAFCYAWSGLLGKNCRP